MRSLFDEYIPMRDGVRIPVDIYLPEGDGPSSTCSHLDSIAKYGQNRVRSWLPH